ncbi:MAG: LCP family protein, partial [Clostridia bacterium]|nr:LCP family protein [Clostridia bacterium]
NAAAQTAASAKKKMPAALKIVLIALISIVSLAVIAAGAAFAYYQHIFNQIVLPETEDNVILPKDEDFVTDDPNESYIIDDDTSWDEYTETEPNESETANDGTSSDVTSDVDDPSVTTTKDASATEPGKSSLTSEKVTYQDPASISWPEDLTPLGDDGLINIMLVGQDNGSFKSRGRSDSMILLSVNPSTGGISLVSFLRDTYVQIGNGYSDNRLNAAYKFGGFKLMFDVMKRNFGITCDYGIVVNFESFIDIIDTLGGVDLTFTEKEVKNLVKNGFGTYPDGSVAKIGLNKNVPGHMALAYARIRKIDSDFNRTARQRKLLMSVYNRFKDADLSTILKLVNNVTNYIRVYNMTSMQLLDLVSMLYPLIGNEVKSYSVPGSGEYSYASMRGMSVVLPKLEKIRESLKKKLPLGTADYPVTADKTTEPPVVTTEVTSAAPVSSDIPDTSGSEPVTSETAADVSSEQQTSEIITDAPPDESVTEETSGLPDTGTDAPETEDSGEATEIQTDAPETEPTGTQ